MTNRQVTVYWSATWQSCHAAKEFLSSHGVAFTAKNVAEDPAARDELLAQTGRMAVPVIMVDEEVIVGFDRGRLQRLLGIWPMTTVRCPDCAEELPVAGGARSGDVVDCPNCAGHPLRLAEAAERWTATIAHTVSCPNCEQVLVLAETAKAGDRIECCGQRYRLTFEYGAFALEA